MSISHENFFAEVEPKRSYKAVNPINKVCIKQLKVVQASKVFFKSWQSWQKKIFLSILVQSFPKKRLQSLKSALEPVYHRNYLNKTGAKVKFHSWAKAQSRRNSQIQAEAELANDSSLKKAQWLQDHFIQMMKQNKTFGEIYRSAYDEVATRELIPGTQRQMAWENNLDEDLNGKKGRSRRKVRKSIATSKPMRELNIKENDDDDDDELKILEGVMKKYNPPDKSANIEAMIEESISHISTMNVNTDDYFSSNSSLPGRHKGLPSINRTQSEILFGSHSWRNKAPIPITKQVYKKAVLWPKNLNMVTAKSASLRDLYKKQMTYIFDNLKNWNENQRSILLMRILEGEDGETLRIASQLICQTLQALVEQDRNIALLPETFWFNVFRRLSSQDLINIEHTNKRLQYLANIVTMWKVVIRELGESYGVPELVSIIVEHLHKKMDVNWRETFFLLRDHLMENYDAQRKKIRHVEVFTDPSHHELRSVLDLFDRHIKKNRRRVQKDVDVERSISGTGSCESVTVKTRHDLERKFTKMRTIPEKKEKRSRKEKFESKTSVVTPSSMNLSTIKSEVSDISYDCFWAERIDDLLTHSQLDNLGLLDEEVYVDSQATEMIRKNRVDFVRVKEVMVMTTNGSPINCVLCHNGFVYTAANDQKIRVWTRDGARFKKLGEMMKGSIQKMVALPNTHRKHEWHKVYAASWDTGVMVWNTFNWNLMCSLHGHTDTVSGIAIDDEYIVTCSHDRTIRVWRMKDMEFVRVIRVHSAPVYALALDKKRIITAGAERLICVSCPRTGRLIDTLKGHQRRIRSIAVVKNQILSGDASGVLYVWSPNTSGSSYTVTRKIRAHYGAINAIKVASSRQVFTASSDRTIKEWDTVSWMSVRLLQGHNDEVVDIDCCSKYLASVCKDGSTRVWWWDI